MKVVRFDLATGATDGEPVTVPDVRVATAGDNGAAEYDVSDAGTLVYIAPSAEAPLSVLVWKSLDVTEEPLPVPPGRYLFPRISPDGRYIALDTPGPNRGIWIWDVQRQLRYLLTRSAAEDMLPVWSPTSGRLFYASQQSGNFDVYSQPADGATPERSEFVGPGDQFPNAFARDGDRLLINENHIDLSLLTLSKGGHLAPLLHTSAREGTGDFSRDGNWYAYDAQEERGLPFEVFIHTLPGAAVARRVQVSTGGGRYPKWSKDGRTLYYVALSGMIMAASITLSPTPAIGPVTKLFDIAPPPADIVTPNSYDVSMSDGRFLLTRPAGIARRSADRNRHRSELDR
jgi:Tol biopolymer transport system component